MKDTIKGTGEFVKLEKRYSEIAGCTITEKKTLAKVECRRIKPRTCQEVYFEDVKTGEKIFFDKIERAVDYGRKLFNMYR